MLRRVVGIGVDAIVGDRGDRAGERVFERNNAGIPVAWVALLSLDTSPNSVTLCCLSEASTISSCFSARFSITGAGGEAVLVMGFENLLSSSSNRWRRPSSCVSSRTVFAVSSLSRWFSASRAWLRASTSCSRASMPSRS